MQLPVALRRAVDREVDSCNTAQLRAAALRLSQSYREANAASALISDVDRAAYLAVRLPATCAAVTRALQWTRENFSEDIHSLLDLGSGPGTALWAAAEQLPALDSCTALERDARFAALGQRLAQQAEHPALRNTKWITADLSAGLPQGQWDLVLCSYALNELSAAQRGKLVAEAWSHAAKLLVVIEPGTKTGFANLSAARQQLLAASAHIVAPCPHTQACPMQQNADWCHFAARVERTSDHRRLKDAALGHEDEKFSFIAFARQPLAVEPHARIVRHPQIASGYTQISLCTPEGTLVRTTVTRSQKDDWRRLKRLSWGDRW
ncbi:MAG: small ribosomal subunit Rsm22 family protein [Acidobacteriota bacterium]|nr:small ribosomal subunit Rsm22 family protein [Acidobacteriota bacterium]